MPYEILKHTADLRMKVSGKTLQELFLEALKGMMAIVRNEKLEMRNERVERPITVLSTDRTALLVDFLNEALSLSQVNREVYVGVEFTTFSDIALEGSLSGVKVDKFDEDIKAVTYHEAEVRQNEKGEWETMLVFDI